MKQAFAAILALMMALGALAQRNVVYIEDFEICPDSTVTLPVMMANSDPTRGIQFNMSLPLGLNLIEKELTEYSLEKYFMVFAAYTFFSVAFEPYASFHSPKVCP